MIVFKRAKAIKTVRLNPVGLGLAGVGALLMFVSAFLQRVDVTTTTFDYVVQNTLIQSGDGWWFIALAIGVIGATYRAYHRSARTFAPLILGGIGIAIAIYDGTAKSALELCPTDSFSLNVCQMARPGIGVYAAGVGAALVVLGGWQILRSKPTAVAVAVGLEAEPRSEPTAVAVTAPAVERPAETKACPDCAETVLAQARACRYCGFRFETELPPENASLSSA